MILANASHGAEWFVGIYNYYFAPTNLTIAPGDKVTWINMVTRGHDTTYYDPNNPDVSLWSSDVLEKNQSFSYIFADVGTYPYVCAIHYFDHLEQTGVVFVAQANLPPSVSITNPVNGATVSANFAINAEASDSDGSVVSVEFLVDGNSAGVSQGPIFTANVNGLPAGNHTLTAVATDNGGLTGNSPPVNITVQSAPTKFPLTVTVQPQNGGSVGLNPPPPGDGYDAGTMVTLTASAANGFAFMGWSGAITTTENPTTITMDAAKTVTANFSVNQNTTHTLTLLANPVGAGTVQANPAPNGAGGTYVDGTAVTLTAVPTAGFLFTNFSGGVNAATNPVTFTINSDVSVTANFVSNNTPTFVLTLATNPSGAGTIQASPSPNAPGGSYYEGTLVTLTANALGTNAFTNWSGDVSSTSNRITLVMNANKTATANFVPIIPPTYTLTIFRSPTNGGNVLVTPGANSNGTYSANTTVALAAQPNAGFEFVNWSGAVNTTNNPIVVVMSADRTVTANFQPIPPVVFDDVAATYAGLLMERSETNFTASGFLSVRVSKAAAYRGTATIGGIRQSIAGQFDRFGYAPLVLRRGSLSGSLQLDGSRNSITGTLTDGDKSPTLLLYRAMEQTNAAAFADDYVLTFGAVAPVANVGTAKLRLSANGKARVNGQLGDGVAFTGNSFLSPDARVPLFVPLYHRRGVMLGWLNIATDGTLQGRVRWLRPGDSRSRQFPQGFALEIPVTGFAQNLRQSRAEASRSDRDVICGQRSTKPRSLLANLDGSPFY